MTVETKRETRERIELPAIDGARLLAGGAALVIDLRSPSEFAQDHVPGARNLPLFDDVARALVGTLYRQRSPAEAFEEGWRHVRANVGALVEEIAALAGWRIAADGIEAEVDRLCADGLDGLAATLHERPTDELPPRAVVFHCWRGGLRSQSVVALLTKLGFDRAVLLSGGYRAYRREIVRAIETWRAPPALVLRGWTGVGKTLVLQEIEQLRPGATIDLEELAGHRSSLLGMVGLEPCTQKTFESRLAARMRVIAAADTVGLPVVFEGESRKVGDVILPPSVWRSLDGGANLELVAGLERRIEVLKQDYLASPDAHAALLRQLPLVEARMQRDPGTKSLCTLLQEGAVDELVRILLERYYDPLYRHSEKGRRYAARFDATDPARAAREIVAWIDAVHPERGAVEGLEGLG